MSKIPPILPALLIWPCLLSAQLNLNPNPSRAIGHPKLQLQPTVNTPNFVEGTEFNGPQGVALDTSVSPPILYVADTGNNRVLAWRDATRFENGAPADLVIGQRDRISTLGLGPGTSFSSGLSSPTSVAVDRSGRLYVADSGNHRVVRYPRPFQQADEIKLADMAIGQANLSSRTANSGGLSARSLSLLSSNSAAYRTALLFDAQGNLWFTDAGNHRVLRYRAQDLGDGAGNQPAADLVIGQPDFTTNSPAATSVAGRTNKTKLYGPSGLAFDQSGRLYVVDSLSRVLVFTSIQTGAGAARLMGIPVQIQGQPTLPAVNDTGLSGAEGILVINDIPLVMDAGNHRILRYDPFERWPPEATTLISPAAKAVIGQDSFNLGKANRGRATPDPGSFNYPVQAAFAGGETFLVDSLNHRVLVLGDLTTGPATTTGPPYEAKRVLGQLAFDLNSPNLLDGRGLNLPQGMAVDATSTPPHLYVADTLNNRVLCFRDLRGLRPGDGADFAIGQFDVYHSLANAPSNDTSAPNPSGLLRPSGVAVDSEGNLWVADTSNGRVLRFPKPFEQNRSGILADLVLGQATLTARVTDATRTTMGLPYGLCFTPDGNLVVSDAGHNRALLFRKPFQSGMQASVVYGQPDFITSTYGADTNKLRAPRQVASDTGGRIYVADTENNRVVIYRANADSGSDAAFVLSKLNRPAGVYVSPVTGEIWVANTGANQVLRYPNYDRLAAVGGTSDATIPEYAPQAVTLDPFGDLLVSDGIHRVVMHFPGLTAVNAANGLSRLTPGMYATLRPSENSSFGDEEKVFDSVPMNRSLGGVQVLMDESPIPLHYVSPKQINCLIPNNAPTSGNVELQVVRVATGQILGSYLFRMDAASPGLFTVTGSGSGQAAALNQDNSLNSAQNPIARGEVITLYGTGAGHIPGAPADGEPASGQVLTDSKPRVFIGADYVADSDILYSGLAPGSIGLWQINVRIPSNVFPSNTVAVVVFMKDIASSTPQVRTTIAVKQ